MAECYHHLEMQEMLSELISRIQNSTDSSFYQKRWEGRKTISDFPTVSRTDFIDVPLSERRYKNERSFVKIVHDREGSFLSEWSFDDIGREPWGLPCARPMVYVQDPHEAIEKSMWYYENNMIPLIAEPDPDFAAFAASKYQIDSLLCDELSLNYLHAYLQGRDRPLESLCIHGSTFVVDALLPFVSFSKHTKLILHLPEVGAIAESSLQSEPTFKLFPGRTLERVGDTTVLTRDNLLVTPIVRYALPTTVAQWLAT